ncbi:myoferlin-like isoform X4 [Apodemus sylvaticus]|uniref:myoferlin-like isoform X4 n=1 Tax=Apodemus sylvaticus TaxID=10129 RepID=UPI002241A900|nr:myoferlin-like isoform X4 [Apodemus sylvaticus]XP_052028027.1 myoferlin-like isoform X4 [Apodemus sylvaticus]
MLKSRHGKSHAAPANPFPVAAKASSLQDANMDADLDSILCWFWTAEGSLNTKTKYQRRLKCSLSAVFHSAIMLQDVGEAIQFEVSIGNYGNKFDATCNPLASTTQYSRAVFDGNYYYYLPWAHTKPIVTLTSYWEDISYRLDAVNTLLVMAEWLQSNIEAVKSGIQGKIPANQLAEVWLKMIDEVIEDMRYTLPVTEGKTNVTVLDTQIQKLRSRFLSQIHEAALRMRSEATDVKSTLLEIEEWLDKLMQLTEEEKGEKHSPQLVELLLDLKMMITKKDRRGDA